MADWNFQRVVDIMRRVISRRNQTDSLSSDNELMRYIGEFMRDLMPQELKMLENFDTFDFDTIADTETYSFAGNLNGDFFENIGTVAYSDEVKMIWFQDPGLFYEKWGFDTNIATPQTSQPSDILFYNNQFVLKTR